MPSELDGGGFLFICGGLVLVDINDGGFFLYGCGWVLFALKAKWARRLLCFV